MASSVVVARTNADHLEYLARDEARVAWTRYSR